MQYQQFSEIEQQQSTLNLSLFYLFFNSGSGSIKASQFSVLDCADITISIEGRSVQISFFSIQNVPSRNQGYNKLKEDLQQNRQIPIVIAGGDGTMMWVVEQMIDQQIDINQIVIIPLPCGTGNDFSNALGWDTDIPGNMLENDYRILKQYVKEWQKGHQCYFDIWDVLIQTQPDGFLLEVKKTENGATKQSLKDLDGANKTSIEKKMSNYFSIGVDARIGFGFDKNRTTNRHLNKICYCLQGIQKMFLKTKQINQVIEFVEHYHHQTQECKTLFKTADCNDKDALTVPGNPVTLVCLNINSYAAGIKNIWQNAKSPEELKQKTKISSEKTSFSDGLLEFISFDSLVGIGGERILSGNATRLAQTNGPLLIKFKETQQILNSYLQVDGQYLQIVNPSTVEILPCKQLPQGKIRVLLKD